MITRDDVKQSLSLEGESMKKKTVMIVEDDRILSDLSEARLVDAGYNVISVHDGQGAIEKLTNGNIPDLILMDIMMPTLDGFDVLDLIVSNSLWGKIPVIVLSNLSEKSEIDDALRKGAKEFLIKSHFTLTEVLRKIDNYLDR